MRETLLQLLEQAIAEDPEDYAGGLAAHVGAKILEDNIVDERRWYNIHEVVFEKEFGESSEYVKGTYCDGATELQDDTEKNWEFVKVSPVLVTTTKYEVVYE